MRANIERDLMKYKRTIFYFTELMYCLHSHVILCKNVEAFFALHIFFFHLIAGAIRFRWKWLLMKFIHCAKMIDGLLAELFMFFPLLKHHLHNFPVYVVVYQILYFFVLFQVVFHSILLRFI